MPAPRHEIGADAYRALRGGGGPSPPCAGCGRTRSTCTCLEDALLFQIRAAGLPDPIREYPFAAPRKWRADFAWPDARLLVEVDGGIGAGRHTTPVGYAEDCRKLAAAVLLGWRVIRVSSILVKSGEALALVEAALAEGGND